MFDFNTVPINILTDWINSQISSDREMETFIVLIKLSDIDKEANFLAYLRTRVTSETTEVNNLAASVQTETDSLNADINSCNGFISQLQK